MIIDTLQVEKVLLDKAIAGYTLEAETGVQQNVISRLRRGESKLENMSLKNIMKIQAWIDNKQKKNTLNS